MKKYLFFFRIRFITGLQYRAAAFAGIVTQFAWGFLSILTYRAFYRTDAASFPMSLSATVSYLWLQQAFLSFFAVWMMENDIFDTIVSGNISYELCRPVDLYGMWYTKSAAMRLSRAALRCFPILLVAAFLPEPYGIAAPASLLHFLLFLIALLLGFAMTVSFCMFVYILAFYTISPQGLRILFTSSVEFFAGAVIPLPFFPERLQKIMELLPFAAMQNVALRIYSGSMDSYEIKKALILQIFWLAVMTGVGKILCSRAVRKVTVQGG